MKIKGRFQLINHADPRFEAKNKMDFVDDEEYVCSCQPKAWNSCRFCQHFA
ncbi:hypothetical protein KUC_1132 [Vreelandella boliviensis LC1]|uniref:Uncharacterized protein n=1 Tax=Vreelandella boliviensis LC1 TaxID=1072583 RepID=A0A7U9C3A1_9GAMM|nr:hypothetical protein KUC_1132 [Halomonas boliviensis LC1]